VTTLCGKRIPTR